MQNQISENWWKVKLGEIAQNFDTLRVPLSSMQRINMKGKYPYYGAAEIVDHINDYHYEGLHVLIAEDGTVYSDGNKPMLQLVNGRFWVNNHAHVLRGKNDTETKYLFYALKNTPITPYITGAVQLKLTRENLDRIEFPYPKDLDARHKIVTIVSAFDNKIELNNKIAKNLEEITQAIFKEWFVKNKTKLQTQKIKDLGKVVTGKTPSTKDLLNFGTDCPFVTIPDMTNTFVLKAERYLSQKSADRMQNLILPAESVCVSCIATVGLVSITTEESITNQQINSIIPNKEYYTYFLYQFFKRNKNLLQAYGAAGSTTLIINKTQFESLNIDVPDDLTMKKFDQLVRPMYKNLLTISEENQKLAAMRGLLLPKLMKGEIRV